jgi:hypothetical protein
MFGARRIRDMLTMGPLAGDQEVPHKSKVHKFAMWLLLLVVYILLGPVAALRGSLLPRQVGVSFCASLGPFL